VASSPSAPRGPEEPIWSTSPAAAARRLSVDPEAGLSTQDARERLGTHGLNRLREVKPPSAWRILFDQFASVIVALLAVAAVVAYAFGEWLDGTAILTVLALNSLIGFVTEHRAVRSMEALRSLGSVRARVRRDGREVEVPATQLVPGDVLLLDAGDVVTADARLCAASNLEVDESALTGESLPVRKSVEPTAADAPLAERTSMLFKGTAVTRGTAESVVTGTGMDTELGRIARLVQEAEKEVTPLEKRLASLGRWLVWAAVGIAAVTALVGIAAGKPAFLMIETAIALAVAAIPEGLPIVATMALARGMWRMARKHALLNRLSAVETLGATTVIFTDKTGTLTENRMDVRVIALADSLVQLGADGGRGFRENGDVDPRSNPALRAAVEVAVLCNNATLATDLRRGIGDPMEVALLRLGVAAGLARETLLEASPEVRQEAFDAARLMMATVHRAPGGPGYRIAVKGAAEAVIAASTSVLDAMGQRAALGPADRERWMQRGHELASDGLRVLAVARRDAPAGDAEPYEDLTLLGLLGLADPPRPEVRGAIAACRAAGIRVVMVTGDHAGTAVAIARAVGLVEGECPRVVVGADLERAAGEAEPADFSSVPIFARVTPEQKLALIAAFQRMGHVVAMTGDGVNDAPALRKADIGVAMGRRGTQVAREAADMVLTDDAFASIVAAVAQGRIIFDNIRKFVFYLLSCNVSEVLVVSLAALIGAPLPLLPLQILFLNLVTDVFPALALSFGEGDPGILRHPPRDPREPILTRRAWLAIGGFGLVISASVLVALHLARSWLGYSGPRAVTVSFLTLAAAQLWHVFDARAKGAGLLRNDVTRNPWVLCAIVLCALLLLASVYLPGLGEVLSTEAPGPAGWALVAVMSLVPLVLGQAWMVVGSIRAKRARTSPARGDYALRGTDGA